MGCFLLLVFRLFFGITWYNGISVFSCFLDGLCTQAATQKSKWSLPQISPWILSWLVSLFWDVVGTKAAYSTLFHQPVDSVAQVFKESLYWTLEPSGQGHDLFSEALQLHSHFAPLLLHLPTSLERSFGKLSKMESSVCC